MVPRMGTFSPNPGRAARQHLSCYPMQHVSLNMMRPKLVIGGSPPCRGASVTSAQMDREACNAEVRAVKAIPLDTRSLLSILQICAPEACLLVGFDWPRTDSSIRYSSRLFTAPTSIMLVPGSARPKLHSSSDRLQDFGCATLGKSPVIWRSSCTIPSAWKTLPRLVKSFAISDKPAGREGSTGSAMDPSLRLCTILYYSITMLDVLGPLTS